MYKEFEVMGLNWEAFDFEFEDWVDTEKSKEPIKPGEKTSDETLVVFNQKGRYYRRFKITEAKIKFISLKDESLKTINLRFKNIISTEQVTAYALFKRNSAVVAPTDSGKKEAPEEGNKEMTLTEMIVWSTGGVMGLLIIYVTIRKYMKRRENRLRAKKREEETNLVYDL